MALTPTQMRLLRVLRTEGFKGDHTRWGKVAVMLVRERSTLNSQIIIKKKRFLLKRSGRSMQDFLDLILTYNKLRLCRFDSKYYITMSGDCNVQFTVTISLRAFSHIIPSCMDTFTLLIGSIKLCIWSTLMQIGRKLAGGNKTGMGIASLTIKCRCADNSRFSRTNRRHKHQN